MTRVKSPYIASHTCCANSTCMLGAGPGKRLVTRGKRKTVRVSGGSSYRDRLHFQFATLTHSY